MNLVTVTFGAYEDKEFNPPGFDLQCLTADEIITCVKKLKDAPAMITDLCNVVMIDGVQIFNGSKPTFFGDRMPERIFSVLIDANQRKVISIAKHQHVKLK